MSLAYYYAKVIQLLHGKAVKSSRIHPTAKVNWGCNISHSTIDKYSYCGHDCQIVNSEIGAFCSISDHVFIGGAEHPLEWVSTSPVFQNVRHSGPKKRFAGYDIPKTKRTIIGSDVWIGHAATIKQGVSIGHGAIVGSNSMVTKDVPPYAIVGGVPARIIKYRFSEEIIEKLLATKWWLSSDDLVSKYAKYMKDIHAFINKWGGVTNGLSICYDFAEGRRVA